MRAASVEGGLLSESGDGSLGYRMTGTAGWEAMEDGGAVG